MAGFGYNHGKGGRHLARSLRGKQMYQVALVRQMVYSPKATFASKTNFFCACKCVDTMTVDTASYSFSRRMQMGLGR